MDLVQNLLIKIKKNCPWTWSTTGGPWTRSMKVVHGPGPKRGSMDPWSMYCPHPSKLVVHPFKTFSVNTKDFVLVLLYQVLTEDFLGANFN